MALLVLHTPPPRYTVSDMACKTKKAVSPAPVALPYFQPEALKFLRSLARHNDREWFQPRKAEYEALLREPMLAIVRKINDAMMDFAPEHIRPAEKTLFRIYRDNRFSEDKSPYKTHIAAWWPRAGCEKISGAGYYFHVEAKEVIVAAGCWFPEKDQLLQIRQWLLENHATLRPLLKKAGKLFPEFEGKPLVRAPKGFDPEHAGMDLIRCRQWGLSSTLEPEAALSAKIADRVIQAFRLAAPVVNALNEPIAAAMQPKKKVLFGLR